MLKPPRPIINAMLVCDQVISEEGSHKKSLIGIFGNISAVKFPCVHHSLYVYIKLTEANGKYKFHLELVDLETGSDIARTAIPDEIEIKNPLISHDLVFNLRGLKFDRPGKYEFRIFANEEIVGQKTFWVNEAKTPGAPQPEE